MRIGVCLVLLLAAASGLAYADEASKKDDGAAVEFFEKRVRPLLVERCFACHGEDQAESELRLDSRADMLEGGSRGAAVVPGEPEKSLIIRAVNHADTLAMPPKEKLSQREINDLTAWVKAGAVWPGDDGKPASPKKLDSKKSGKPGAQSQGFTDEQKSFWSFQPMSNLKPPRVADDRWGQSPIDRFVLNELESRGLKPAEIADRRTLIRRATFDLHGIPPTPDEVAEFIADNEPDAFARLIDRLLASPRYGERWGRHWLDVARYGDSNGLDENLSHANAFRYRDWVIAALNRDLPYDEFIREQIAGDLLPPDGDPNDPAVAARQAERLTATGFLVIGAKMLAEDDPLKMQMDIVDEQIDTLGKAFLGMTLGCARCHDHKYDPITMADYYSLAGIFKSTKTMNNFNVVAQWQERPIGSPAELQQIGDIKQQIAAKQADVSKLISTANGIVLKEARGRVAEYVRAAAREIYIEKTSRSFGPLADKALKEKSPLPDGVQVIEAESYVRGNAIKLTSGYGEGIGVILSNGNGEWAAEYDVTVPAAGPYQIELRYAAADSRPSELSVNGQVVKPDALREVTGSWFPDTQRWHVEGTFDFKAGVNTIRLFRKPPFPHIDKLLIAKTNLIGKTDLIGLAGDVSPPVGTKPADSPRTGGLTSPASQSVLNKSFVAQWRRYLERTVDDATTPLTAWRELLLSMPGLNPDQVAAKARDLLIAANSAAEELANAVAADKPDPRQESLRKLINDSAENAPFAIPKNVEEYFAPETVAELKQHRDEIKQLEASVPKLPEVMAVSEGTIADLPIHLRGNHTTLAKETQPRRFPRIFVGEKTNSIASDRSGRLEFANWLTEPTHPLTARVAVNRLWIGHFGAGLVRSPDNFGLLGEKPTHAGLLDWLAREFVVPPSGGSSTDRPHEPPKGGTTNWSLKRLHRAIMLSSVYQQATTFNEAAFLADPDNRLWWRRNRRRLEVEAVRDSLLFAAGELDNSMGGSHLPTPNRQYVTSTANVNPKIYDIRRRSVYLPVVRSSLYDLFQIFDFAEPSVMTGQRDTTTIATQALFALNSALVSDQAKQLTERLMTESDDSARIRRAYQIAFQREPTSSELVRSLDFVKQLSETSDAATPADRTASAWRSFSRTILAANEFLFVE